MYLEVLAREAKSIKEVISNPLRSGLDFFEPDPELTVPYPWNEQEICGLCWHVWCFCDTSKNSYLLVRASAELEGERHLCGWSKEKCLRIDESYSKVILWLNTVKDLAVLLWPKESSLAMVGSCESCHQVIEFSDLDSRHCCYSLRDMCFCDQCHDLLCTRQVVARSTKASVKERRPRKRDLVCLDPAAELLDRRLRQAVYRAYKGRCQYCHSPGHMAKEEVVLEHIIPSSIPLADVSSRLVAMGVNISTAREFCSSQLPPRHNCVLNYSLACVKCNSTKSNRLLHPVALEALLSKARSKSRRVLHLYNQS